MDTSRTAEHQSVTNAYARSLEEEIARIRPWILILGPSINGKRLNPAARLRRELLKRSEEHGAIIKGEHKSLIAASRRAAKAGHNLCSHELKLAHDSELIIIVPASPGSFAELGQFALDEAIAPKSLILFDKKYKNCKSYLRYGPRKVFTDRRAKVYDVDYRDIEGVWKKVEKQIYIAKQRIRDRQLHSEKTRSG